MKPLFSRTLMLIVFGFTVCFSCERLGTSDFPPGISIYKTNGDYFELADIGMKGDRIYWTSTYLIDFGEPTCKLLVVDNDTVYRYRQRLQDGFVLDAEADEQTDVFLSLSYKEYLIKEQTLNTTRLPDDTLKKYILDKDPYKIFYRNKTEVKRFFMSDSLEIIEIIRDGQIDEYFKRIK
jgi:hypothetical protein